MTEFEESEDDNDDLNDTHAITFPPINLDGIDDMTAPQPPQNNGKRTQYKDGTIWIVDLCTRIGTRTH